MTVPLAQTFKDMNHPDWYIKLDCYIINNFLILLHGLFNLLNEKKILKNEGDQEEN